MAQQQQFAFPNVSFQETIVGPIPFQTEYRNRVGIAGIFRRGPRGAARVTNRQDAAYLYGDDNSPGAIAVRQVLLQGATDLVISRATPRPTESEFLIKLGSVLPTNEAQIGYNGNVQQFHNGNQVQTTGIKLDVRYIGQAMETVRAAGSFSVSEASSLTPTVNYKGLGLFEFVAEEYLPGNSQFTVASSLSNVSNDLSFDLAAPTTFTLGASFTLTDLSSTSPVTANQVYVLTNGMQITIDVGGTSATVTKNPATMAAATYTALQVKTLNITSLRTNLAADSYLYFSNATFKTVDDAAPSNNTVALKGTLTSATPTVTIAQGATPDVEQIIAKNALVSASATYTPETGSIENQLQWVYADRTVTANQALIANLKPGRLLYSNSAVEFNQTSGRPLMVMSTPMDDPANVNQVRFLVKGEIAANLSSAAVHLYETPKNIYIFSSTFRMNSGGLPEFAKKADSPVVTTSSYSDGVTSIQVASLPYRVDPGFIIDFDNGSRFTIDAQANAGSAVTLNGDLVGSVPNAAPGTLYDPYTYTYLQTDFEVTDRNTVVDNFVVAEEAVQENNFDHRFIFERSDGVVFSTPSGINIELAGIGTSNKIAFLEGGTFNVPVAYASVGIGSAGDFDNFTVGMYASQVLEELKLAVELDTTMQGLLGELEISTSLNPPSLALKSNYTGLDANRLRAIITRETVGTTQSVNADDLMLNATNLTDSNHNWESTTVHKFAGATAGSRPAFRDLFSIDSDPLVRIVALSEGEYGNKLRVSVTPQRDGQFTLYIVDEDSATYQTVPGSETMTLSTRDVNTDGLFNASANSRLVRCYYLPAVDGKTLTDEELDKVPMRLAPSYGDRIPTFNTASQSVSSYSLPVYAQAAAGASYLQNIYLEGGHDAPVSTLPAIEQADILREAVQALEGVDIAILYCAGFDAGNQNYSKVTEEVIGQVNRSNVTTGLRLGVVQAPRNLSATQAQVLASSLDNPRIVLVGGHTSMQGVPGFNNTPGAGFYVGLLAANNPEISPAAAGEGMVPNGIVSVDTPSTTTYLDALTRARTEVLHYDAGMGVYKFLNGISTTSDHKDRYVSIRRTADQILHDLYNNLVWVRSNRNNEALRARVASAVDAYLQYLVRQDRISAYRPTLCNESNNTPTTISQGILNIGIFYTPIFPADFIRVNVVREIEDSLSLQTQ